MNALIQILRRRCYQSKNGRSPTSRDGKIKVTGPIDLILFSLLAAMFILQLIHGYEISELQKEVRMIQMEGR